MSYLLDTNILLRLNQDTHPMHTDTADAVKKLLNADEEIFIIPQTLIEFWAVATRPVSYNGLGLTLEETEQELAEFKSIFTLRLDIQIIYFEWERLVKLHKVSGKQVHDARIVAAMLAHRIDTLLTFNIQDFKRYHEIQIANPAELANS